MSAQYHTLVVGGGPSGMMAAIRSAQQGFKTLLVEKNPSLGKKLLITGGGRCNFTNAAPDPRTFVEKFGKSGRALLSPLSQFSSQDCLSWFEKWGMKYKVEAENRAFPQSDLSSSVLETLIRALTEHKVEIKTHYLVRNLRRAPEGHWILEGSKSTLEGKRVILATGGLARPETGSTGDGFHWLSKLGVSVREPDPSLVPITLAEQEYQQWMGLSFSEVQIRVFSQQKKLLTQKGKLLFTHFGLSGPLILGMSSFLHEKGKIAPVTLELDFFPHREYQDLEKEILDALRSNPKKTMKNILSQWFPSKMIPLILKKTKGESVFAAQFTKEQRIWLWQKGCPSPSPEY